MLGPGLTNLQKFDDMETCANLLTTFATLIPNADPRVLRKGPGEGVIYLQNSSMYKWRNSAGHVAFTVHYCTRRTYLTIYFSTLIIFFGYVVFANLLKRFKS